MTREAPTQQSTPSEGTRGRVSSRRWRRALAWLAIVALYLGIAWAVMALLLQQPVSRLAHVEASVRQWKYVGVALQVLAVAGIAAGWARIVAWAAMRGLVRPAEQASLVALRWKVVLFLCAYLLFVVVGLGDLHRLLMSTSR